MYPSHVEYHIEDFISSIPQSFIESFIGSFSTDHPENNHLYLEQLNDNCNTILFLIQMIKEGIVDENQEYSSLLFVAFPFLNKIIKEDKDKIQELYDSNKELPENLLQSAILYLLPYMAQNFQNQNDINNFKLLLSSLLSICRIDMNPYYLLFNNYIDFLLSNPEKTPYHIIIALYFTSNLFYIQIEDNNHKLLIQLFQEKVQSLAESDFHDEIEVMIYKIIFDQLGSFLADDIIYHFIPLDMVCQSILNYMKIIIDKCENQAELDCEGEFNILNSIFHFLSILYGQITLQKASESPNIQDLTYLLTEIYHSGSLLSKYENFGCSQLLIQFIFDNIDFLCIDSSSQTEIDYFVDFISIFSILTEKDMEEIQFSQENFFYDNFEIEYDQQSFTQRQIIAKFIREIYNNEKTESFIQFLLNSLYEIDLKSIEEYHLFLISQIIQIALKQNDNEQIDHKYGSILHDISAKYIPYISEFIYQLINSSEGFRNPTYTCFIFSYYNFIDTAFHVLDDSEVKFMNDVVNNIYSILCSDDKHEFSSLLFTYLCITSYILLSRDQLEVDLEQLFPFIATHSHICLTNHANMFSIAIAEKTDNFQFLLPIYDNYLFQCENFFQELIPLSQKSKDEHFIIPEEIKQSKDYNYRFNLCLESINQIAKIMHMIDEFPFDEQRLLDLIHLLTYFEVDWEFSNEEVFLMSEIIIKVPNVKEWIKFYIDNVKDSSRMLLYGEWIIPLIYLVSYVPDSIDDELFNYISEEIMNFFELTNIETFVSTSDDFLMLMNFIVRLFELGFIEKVNISQDFLSFFYNIVDTVPSDFELYPDFDPLNHRIGGILIKISAILAKYQIQQEELHEFLEQIVNEGLIINDELRFLTITLIDNAFPEDSRIELNQLREMCLNNTIPKNEEYFENYCNDSTCFFIEIPHPIMKFHDIDGFIPTAYE